MEGALSTGEDPLWIVPYTTIAADFQDLLDDYTTYIDVWHPTLKATFCISSCAVGCCCTNTSSCVELLTFKLDVVLCCTSVLLCLLLYMLATCKLYTAAKLCKCMCAYTEGMLYKCFCVA